MPNKKNVDESTTTVKSVYELLKPIVGKQSKKRACENRGSKLMEHPRVEHIQIAYMSMALLYDPNNFQWLKLDEPILNFGWQMCDFAEIIGAIIPDFTLSSTEKIRFDEVSVHDFEHRYKIAEKYVNRDRPNHHKFFICRDARKIDELRYDNGEHMFAKHKRPFCIYTPNPELVGNRSIDTSLPWLCNLDIAIEWFAEHRKKYNLVKSVLKNI